MKNSIRIYAKSFAVFAMIISFISCGKEFLEEERYTDVGYDFLETKEGLESAIVAVYHGMRWYMNGENYFVLVEMGVDFTWNGNDGANKPAFGEYSSALNSANSRISDFWTNNYTSINRANTALMYLDKVADMSDGEKAQRRAELLFLRAYYYFDLVQHFGAIPLVTIGNVSEVITDFKREPVSRVYEQIIADLRDAYEVLPDVWQQQDRGRATKWAAAHLLSEVYLTRVSYDLETRGGKASDLDSVIYYAEQVINSGQFVLEPNYSDIFDQDNQKNTREVIWDVQFTKDALFNEAPASNYRIGGNQIHNYWIMEYQTKPGMLWDWQNSAPFKRVRPNPMIFSESLWEGDIDSRLYKSFKWVYYANNPQTIPVWEDKYYYIDPATNEEDRSDVIYTTPAELVGKPKFNVGDTAIYTSPAYYGSLDFYTAVQPRQAILNDTKYREMLRDIAKSSYTLIPIDHNNMLSFPTLLKHIDLQLGADLNRRAGSRNFIRMRFAETYLIAAEAYGRKEDWSNALNYINTVRKRAAFADGEAKAPFAYQLYGGSNDDVSTVSDMMVSQSDVIHPKFPSGDSFNPFVDWMLEERARELYGELNRWEDLVRTGTLVERVKRYNPDAAPNIQNYHKLRPIPDVFIDRLIPKPPVNEVQNPGY